MREEGRGVAETTPQKSGVGVTQSLQGAKLCRALVSAFFLDGAALLPHLESSIGGRMGDQRKPICGPSTPFRASRRVFAPFQKVLIGIFRGQLLRKEMDLHRLENCGPRACLRTALKRDRPETQVSTCGLALFL